MNALSGTKTTQVVILCAALAAMAGCGKGKSTVHSSDDSRFEKVAETNIVKACMLKFHYLWPWFGANADDLRPTQEKLQEFADVLNAQTWKISFGDKTIEIEKFEIGNGFLPDGYCLRVLDSGQAVWPGNDRPPALVLGFLPVERGDGHFIVLLDCERIPYLLRVKITVLDIQTLRTVHEHVAQVDSSFVL